MYTRSSVSAQAKLHLKYESRRRSVLVRVSGRRLGFVTQALREGCGGVGIARGRFDGNEGLSVATGIRLDPREAWRVKMGWIGRGGS
jgi:hypothetical protein